MFNPFVPGGKSSQVKGSSPNSDSLFRLNRELNNERVVQKGSLHELPLVNRRTQKEIGAKKSSSPGIEDQQSKNGRKQLRAEVKKRYLLK